jgi:hypothetical protein
MSVRVSLNLPEDVSSAQRMTPESFVKEMRLTVAVKWYELARIIHEKSVDIPG